MKNNDGAPCTGLRASLYQLILVCTALLFSQAVAAASPADSLSAKDKACMGCHGTAGVTKDLPGGKTLDLHVSAEDYVKSVHKPIGCTGCHADIKIEKHPEPKTIKSAREYSIGMVAVCKTCHEDLFKHHDSSVHTIALKKGQTMAPVCSDCHKPHAVNPTRLAYEEACVKCHDGIKTTHRRWLPNTDLHFKAISCVACHAPGVPRRVDLRLYDKTTGERLTESGKEGVPQFEDVAKAADASGKGLDAMGLRKLLAEIRPEGDTRAALRGRLEVSDRALAHGLVGGDKAIRSCDTCHRQGSQAFQSVTVSMVGEDGKPVRYDASKDVLSSVISVDAISGFYAIGGTRIQLLDWLFILAVLGGLAVPIGHQSMKFLVRKKLAADAEAAKRAGEQEKS